MTTKTEKPPAADLVLLLMYEFQHMTGKKSIHRDEIEMHFDEAIEEFGSIEKATEGVKERINRKKEVK